jgi:hypothetical protein
MLIKFVPSIQDHLDYSNESKILMSIQNQTENKLWTLNQFVINPMTTLEKNTRRTAAKGRQKSQEGVNE